MSSISDENEVIKRWIERINSLDNNDNFSPYRSNDTNSLIVSQIQSTNKLSECDNIQQLIKKNENELTDLQNKFNKCSNINKESVKSRRRRRRRRTGERGSKTRVIPRKSITESSFNNNNTIGGTNKNKQTNKNKNKNKKKQKNKQKQTKTNKNLKL